MTTLMTGKQAKKVLEVFQDTPSEQIQNLIGSGLLTDLRDANISGIDRDEFRGICGLKNNWCEQDSVIYFSVTSDGMTGEKWINRLKSKGFRLSDYAKQLLRSDDFKPTDGVTYKIAVLKNRIFEDKNRVTKKIRAEAEGRGFTTPNAEVACLIREKFSDEELEAMDLWWIVTMHELIEDSDGDPALLSADWDGGGSWLRAFYDHPVGRWCREGGFAFVVSQVSA